ncbi:MAG: N-acetylmuramidase domain-containing protein [Rhizobiaceae bacterium]
MFDDKLLSAISLIASDHDLEPSALMAVVEVESGGRLGAFVRGRFEPLIRFEGHYFYRLLPNAKRNKAIVRGLASPKAGRVRNPMRQASRWKLLNRAQAIDQPAALASCSWGVGQVMGDHWRWLGYASIDALVNEARQDAKGQVQLMMRYIRNAGLVEKLKIHDWSGFARAYNGPGYRKYKYDTRMHDAYKRHVHRFDRPVAGCFLPARNGMHLLRYGSKGVCVRELKQNLKSLGFFLDVDGDFGPATEKMLRAFQSEYRLVADGIFGQKTLERMQRLLPVQILT